MLVDPEGVQQRRVHVRGSQRTFDRDITKFVGRTDDAATSDAASRQPHRVAGGRMVSTSTATRACAFDRWRSAEFSAPDNQSRFQQTSLFKIPDERRDGPVCACAAL